MPAEPEVKSIVNLAGSLGGIGGQAGFTPLTASGYGIVGMTKSTALDHISSGVRLNTVSAAAMDTDRFNHGGLSKTVPGGKLVRPVEVAAAVLFLSSADASAVTGVTLPVDNGWSLCHS